MRLQHVLAVSFFLLLMPVPCPAGMAPEKAIPQLIANLNSSDATIRDTAVEELAKIGKPAMPFLKNALKDQEISVRYNVVEVLRQMRPQTDDVIDLLIQTARWKKEDDYEKDYEEDSGVRTFAVLGLKIKSNIPDRMEDFLIEKALLKNEHFMVRHAAVLQLGCIYPPREKVIDTLIQALTTDENSDVREAAVVGLGKQGSKAERAFPVLSERLKKDDSPLVCKKIISILQQIWMPKEEMTSLLRHVVQHGHEQVKLAAVDLIGQLLVRDYFSSHKRALVAALIPALQDKAPEVKRTALVTVMLAKSEAREAVPVITKLLQDRDENIQESAFLALGSLGLEEAVPALREMLKEKDFRLRALIALARIGPGSKSAVPHIAEALKDPDPKVRSGAAQALEYIGPDSKSALKALILALQDDLSTVRLYAAMAVENIGPDASSAAPALIERLSTDSSPTVRSWAVRALGKFKPATKETLSALETALDDSDQDVQRAAADALGTLGPDARDAVPALITVLRQNRFPEVRRAAAQALGEIGQDPNIVPALIEALRDDDDDIRHDALTYLGRLGPEAAGAISPILELLDKSTNSRECNLCAETMFKIIKTQKEIPPPKLAGYIKQLQSARDTLARKTDDSYYLKDLDLLIRTLKAEQKSQPNVFWELFAEHKATWWFWVLLAIPFYIVVRLLIFLPVWQVLLRQNPLRLYRFCEKISPCTIMIPKTNIPIGLLQFFNLVRYHYHDKVLDAWVGKNLPAAMSHFASLDTVKAREIYVTLPVKLNRLDLPAPSPQDFQAVFSKNHFCLLIFGEGGSGKTSLACQIAKWAASPAPDPMTRRPMLPVLIEDELTAGQESKLHMLLQSILKQVSLMTNSEVPPGLVSHLLAKQRLLVIVDHFSELSPASKKCIEPGPNRQAPVHALIITSRQQEKFQGAKIDTVEPVRLKQEVLSSFIKDYLRLLGKENFFDDRQTDFFDACKSLTQMVGDRDITVLLAKMYVDQIIYAKADPDSPTSPKNIPELMLGYVSWLNRQEHDHRLGDWEVRRISQTIAWTGLEPAFRPGEITVYAIQQALPIETDLEGKLQYLSGNLGLIQWTGPAKNKLKITLDPLAEYLAGLHLLDLYAADPSKWRAFLEKAGTQEPVASVRGFLLAVRDCCLAEGPERGVPAFVATDLAGIANRS